LFGKGGDLSFAEKEYMSPFSTLPARYICLNCQIHFQRPTPYQVMEQDGVIDIYNRLDFKQKGMVVENDQVLTLSEKEIATWNNLQQQYFKPVLCTQCRKPVRQVGPNFKVPGKRDKAGWKKLGSGK
jgi:hypothetical protein